MITESSLKRACTPAVFAHARHVAEGGGRLSKRRCGRDADIVSLQARIESSDSWEAAHKTSAVIDSHGGALVDYACDCASSLRRRGPCKHVMALALDFLVRPERYEGYEASEDAPTSRPLARLIERGCEMAAEVDGVSTEAVPQSVDLDLILTYEVGFGARFRLKGSRGSYAMASITDFVTCIEGKSFYSYGKNLAFVHDDQAFTPRGRAVADVLVRAIRNRRAYSYERVTGRGAFGAPALPAKDLHLSLPELEDLLACYVGDEIRFEHLSSGDGADARALRVVEEDPHVSVSLASQDDGTFGIEHDEDLAVVCCGGRLYAWDARRLYLCTDRLGAHAETLSAVLGGVDGQLRVSRADAPAFCATVLPDLEEAVEVHVPPELDALRPAPCELQFYLDRTQGGVTCMPFARYGSVRVPLVQSHRRQVATEQGLVRDLRAEARGREAARRLFPQVSAHASMVSHASGETLARLVFEGVLALQRLGTVFTTPSFDALRSKARPRVRVGLSVASHLLDVTFEVEGADKSELAGLLESYRLRRRYHRLADGSFVELSKVDVTEAGLVAQELGLSSAQVATGSVSVPAYRMLTLEPALGTRGLDGSVEAYLERIRSVDLGAYEVPGGLEGVLRPYQVDGYRWLSGLVDLGLGGILADEMGLGKSVQLISLLVARRHEARATGPSLVVCPASLVYNWAAELEKFAPQLMACAVAGTAQERQELLSRTDVDVLITSYDLLRRDVGSYAGMKLWSVVLDEAQYVKNHETQTAQAVKSLRSRNRFALTGTPVENRLSELWSVFDFLMPGLLGPYESFRERYERPIMEGDEEVSRRLGTAIGPFVLRRTKRDVMRELPDKIERVVRVRLEQEQRRVYEAQVLELRGQVLDGSDDAFGTRKLQILAGLTRLRQICCDPHLVFEDYQGGSAKTDALLTLVERLADAGQKTLVFSQFTSYLAIVAHRLRERDIAFCQIVGSTPKQRRVELVDQFNGDDTPVFLISLKAGGTGLNLTGASAVVHADPWWNAAAQNQATDRAHRIGQTKDVAVYQLIATNTIEERILELQRAKTQLADAVVSGETSGLSLASLTREDLEELLG